MRAVHALTTVRSDAEISDLDALVSEAVATSSSCVEDAVTLPPGCYASQAFYELEVEKIFKKEWICVGHVVQVPNVGDYFTLEVLGEPMIIVRGADRIRVLSSVCLHRWAPVAEGKGNVKIFSCPFHKWGYALDGRLLGAPFMDRAAGFEPKNCQLPEFRSEIVEELGLIFITFNPDAAPVNETLASLVERSKAEGWEMNKQVIVDAVEQDNLYNWKIQIETYMEFYHHIGAHRKSLEDESPGGRSWCEEDKGTWTAVHGGKKANVTPEELEEKPPGTLINAYPLLMMGMNKKRCGFRILFPVGPNRTKSIIFNMARPEEVGTPEFEAKRTERKTLSEVVNREDNEVNDMQQLGALSEVAMIGRFSHLEACSWHLAEYVRRRIAAI